MVQPNQYSKNEAITHIATQLSGSIGLADFVERVLAIWPSQAKNPAASVRHTIRYEHLGRTLIFRDKKTLLPMPQAMSGVTVRVPLSRHEVENDQLQIQPTFQCLLPSDFPFESLQLVAASGDRIVTKAVRSGEKVKHPFGTYLPPVEALNLNGWLTKQKAKRHDWLLLTILDWAAGRVQLTLEPQRTYRRQRAEIVAANKKLADQLFAQLESARAEKLWGIVAVPTAYAQLKDKLPVPADHWLTVLENDSRMVWDGYSIQYADSAGSFDWPWFGNSHSQTVEQASLKLSKEEKQQVFRFKVYFTHTKHIWRRIEIQGGQTLADMDGILRQAFQHDTSDHLSGFWQRVRRGNSRRFREVELATVRPFGGGEGDGQLLAELGLEPGDSLKYVYDFGDWIEHRLELEATTKPKAGATYPRITTQNKPRYLYCPTCQIKDRQTIATLLCLTCSYEKEADVVMCEDCASPDHDDHYLDEIVY